MRTIYFISVLLILISLASCGNKHCYDVYQANRPITPAEQAILDSLNAPYSPLDSYINASIKAGQDNAKSAADAKAFIDSVNNSLKK